jgi:putative addiction module component (TIGR02574 family)
MRPDAKKVLEEALKLPPEARAALAGTLIESLEEQVDEDAEAQWEAELSRRLQEIQAGKVTLVPWSEARRIIAGTSSGSTPA